MLCTLLNLLEPGPIRRVLLDTVGQRWNSFQHTHTHIEHHVGRFLFFSHVCCCVMLTKHQTSEMNDFRHTATVEATKRHCAVNGLSLCSSSA